LKVTRGRGGGGNPKLLEVNQNPTFLMVDQVKGKGGGRRKRVQEGSGKKKGQDHGRKRSSKGGLFGTGSATPLRKLSL